MKNREIAKIFRNYALLLEIRGDMVFKIRAYDRAAQLLETLDEDIEDIYARNQINELPGIGPALGKKIVQYIEDGKIDHYERLKKQIPVDIEELDKVQGLGPKTILKLYKLLSVKNIADLEKAATQKKISKIKGLGPVVEQNILKSIAFAKSASSRHLLGDSLELAEKIVAQLKTLQHVQALEIAGSLRRRKETIGDIDLLVAAKNHKAVMDFFTSIDTVDKVLAKGQTKSSIRLHGMQVDLRVVDKAAFGAALLHFTGSKEHNIRLRKIALKKGMKVSEYGIFDKETEKVLASKTEAECYKKLGLPFIEPELREDSGEVEAALAKKLPKLVTAADIKGDLQMHSTWSDGQDSILDMAQEAEKLGHEYILITDHLGRGPGNGMDPEKLAEQKKEIEKVNKKVKLTVLQGAEINIQSDGSVNIPSTYLKELDIVLGAIHFGFKQTEEHMTTRLTKAMEHEHIDIIAHPTGRLLNTRPGYAVNFEALFEAAKKTGTILEIDALQKRLDLGTEQVRAAIKAGNKLSIGTDAHSVERLAGYTLGVSIARRGWATKKDIITTYSLKDMLQSLK